MKQQFIAAHDGVGIAFINQLGCAVLTVDSCQHCIITGPVPLCLKLKDKETAVFSQAYIMVILEIGLLPHSFHDKGRVLSGLHGPVYIRTHEVRIFYVIDIGWILDGICPVLRSAAACRQCGAGCQQ